MGFVVRSATAVAFAALSFHPDPALADPGEIAPKTPVLPIYGGENSPTCAWPTAVEVGGCTGTLVHPEVVIYAGHCGSNVSQAFFGESTFGGGGRSVATQSCRTMPGWNPGGGTDFAVCTLAQPVTDVQITPILMGCETDVLTPGREVVLVGFGQTETGGSGVKKQVVTTLDHIVNDEAWLGANGLAPCYGDSGGPAFVKLPASEGYDDTWRVFGVTSHGDQVCGSGGYYGMMHNAVAWLESETGKDITPCHDADGTWNPTPDCQAFPMDPGGSTGAWDDWCTAVPTGGASSTCGDANPEIQGDEEPPTVRIEAPVDGDGFEPDAQGLAAIEVHVEALDDGGVAEVSLQVGGSMLPADVAAPYAFGLTLPEGTHTIVATATDMAGNVSPDASVTVVVGDGADDGGPSDGGPGDGDQGGDADGGGTGGDDAPGNDDTPGAGDPALPAGFGLNGADGGCNVPGKHSPTALGIFLLLLAARRRQRRM
ncbi:MAG: trypsin-like serine protease [Myxococcota bacterium]